jgi:hypothetical protein
MAHPSRRYARQRPRGRRKKRKSVSSRLRPSGRYASPSGRYYAARKSKTPLIAGIVGGVVLLAIIGYFVVGGRQSKANIKVKLQSLGLKNLNDRCS